jgi:tetratricopeptide (TPR) repeat protein
MKFECFVLAALFFLSVLPSAAQKKPSAGAPEISGAAEKKCDAAIEKKSWKSAEVLCRSALTSALRLTDRNNREKMRAYENYAFALFSQSKFRPALDNFTKAFEVGKTFLSAEDPNMGSAYFNLARANQGLSNLEIAVEQYQRAERIFRAAYEKTADAELKSRHKASIRKTLLLQQFVADVGGDVDKVKELEQKMSALEGATN